MKDKVCQGPNQKVNDTAIWLMTYKDLRITDHCKLIF